MTLSSGSRLGAYEIVALVGTGGMGEVYRARDTKLGREVALKVLPDAFAFDPDRVARFEREAKVLASLNHPNIAALHGMEHADGRHFLIMELVEGETLAERLRRGALPVEQALALAIQIADALEAAHEKGVVHRDLKPANVKITPDEQVKVLDFGLAKLAQASGLGPQAPDLSASPTLSVAATHAGVILGTAAYMSPEQAKGSAVDHRSDLFSFGSVLYEMLTGRQPFQGESAPEVLASVLAREPDLTALPPNLNPRIPDLLRRCFEKNPKRRWQAIGDLRAELDAIAAVPHAAAAPAGVARRESSWRRLALLSAPAAVLSAAIAGGAVWLVTRPPAPRVTRLTVPPSPGAALSINGNDRDLAITPDSSRLVYIGANGTQLFVRALDVLEPTSVFKGAPRGPFVSPDGQWVGFVEGIISMRKVAVTGGPAVTIAQIDSAPRGSTWMPDDTIIFATLSPSGLYRVSAGGGMPTMLTRPDRAQGEIDHLWPEALPGGRAVLFTITAVGGVDAAQVAVLDLATGMRKVLVRGGSHAHYVPSGHLIYAAAGTLRAVPFDLDRLETRGTPEPVIPNVVTTPGGGVDAVVSVDGVLAYVAEAGTGSGLQRTLVWVDRQGQETPIPAPPRAYVYPRVSPDGMRVALFSGDQEADVWLWDMVRRTLTRVTFDPALDVLPTWTPDGRRLIFSSERSGAQNLYWQAADGTGAVERLTESPNLQSMPAVTPDGTRVIFGEFMPKTGVDIMQLQLDGARRVTPLVQTPFVEQNGIISPDGRWLAYEANNSGQFEIYVRPFPDVNSGTWQVSTGGGTLPLWAPNGRELFYLSPTGALMRVGVERGPSWTADAPSVLLKEDQAYFRVPAGFPGRSYDISSDGQRFLMIKAVGSEPGAAPPSIVVVQNWGEELKAKVPVP